MKQPISINGQWDLFYSRFSELYDRFSHYEDSNNTILSFIRNEFELKDKIVLDLGAGTGRFSLLFSQLAEKVYAAEPSLKMLRVLKGKIKADGVENIYPINKGVENLELASNSVDIIFSSWVLSGIYNWRADVSDHELNARKKKIESIMMDLEKLLKRQGLMIVVETAPGQYGGELQSVIMGSSEDFSGDFTGWFAKRFNFKIIEKETIFDFKSVNEAVEIFGFVYGEKAKKHILEKGIKTIKMEVRIMIKEVRK